MYLWRDAPPEHVQAIDGAISFAQALAASPHKTSSSSSQWQALFQAANTTALDAEAAGTSFIVATTARDTIQVSNASNAKDAAVFAAQVATDAVGVVNDARITSAVAVIQQAMRLDLELLKALAKQHNWTDNSPVDIALLGPLWPNGAPEAWPNTEHSETLGDRSYILEFATPAGVPDDEIAKSISEVVRLLDRLNRAKGGTGIRVDDEINAFDELAVDTPQPTGGRS
jgi:hypothetical protein